MPSPDRDQAKAHLDRLWSDVKHEQVALRMDADTQAGIAALIASERVTFTYSVATQLLGKLTDHRLDALCLQRGDGGATQWDPRSFATAVIVPWVRANQNVLGKSGDPYVSNPLRQPRILREPPNVLPNTLPLWRHLHDVLSRVETRNDPAYTEQVFRAVLLAVYEELKERRFEYPVLRRVSSAQARYLVRGILKSSQAGEHALGIAAALFTVAGRRFALWNEVRREHSTTADRASRMVGDIECRQEGTLVYAVEVKERQITVADVRSFEEKISGSELAEALIAAPAPAPQAADEINERLRLMWAQGINLHRHTIEGLVDILMSLVGEDGRRDFVVEIGRQLEAHALPSGRLAWLDLLVSVLDGDQTAA